VELRQLIYFEAVARHGGFSRAAEQLRIAQPAVSAQIKRLEAELGQPLLQRTTRRVALTQAGELVLARARAILGQVEGARTDLDELAAVTSASAPLSCWPAWTCPARWPGSTAVTRGSRSRCAPA
jgi:DNA-binding transcriptional LysR family regulator